MGKQETKSSLLEHGVQLMLGRGYHSTGIHDLLVTAGVPKGSFYHHFKNKEDFGLQVMGRYADDGYAEIDRVLGAVVYAVNFIAPIQARTSTIE